MISSRLPNIATEQGFKFRIFLSSQIWNPFVTELNSVPSGQLLMRVNHVVVCGMYLLMNVGFHERQSLRFVMKIDNLTLLALMTQVWLVWIMRECFFLHCLLPQSYAEIMLLENTLY